MRMPLFFGSFQFGMPLCRLFLLVVLCSRIDWEVCRNGLFSHPWLHWFKHAVQLAISTLKEDALLRKTKKKPSKAATTLFMEAALSSCCYSTTHVKLVSFRGTCGDYFAVFWLFGIITGVPSAPLPLFIGKKTCLLFLGTVPGDGMV